MITTSSVQLVATSDYSRLKLESRNVTQRKRRYYVTLMVLKLASFVFRFLAANQRQTRSTSVDVFFATIASQYAIQITYIDHGVFVPGYLLQRQYNARASRAVTAMRAGWGVGAAVQVAYALIGWSVQVRMARRTGALHTALSIS